MTWTRDVPTKPGWYWWRDKQPGVIFLRIYLIYDFDGTLMVDEGEEWKPVSDKGGEWQGPLEPEEA